MKVLIVENTDRERRLLETMVRCAGHEIVVCSRGDQAWWALKGHPRHRSSENGTGRLRSGRGRRRLHDEAFRRIELEARLRVGARMIALRTELAGCLADTEAVNMQLRALQSSAAKRAPTTCPDCRQAFPSPVVHRRASVSS